MSGSRTVAKLYLNCDDCGLALSDGAFQCFKSYFSTRQHCRCIFCSICAQHHEEMYNHDIGRAWHLDDIIASAMFVCPFEGCGQDIPAAQYTHHHSVCPHRRGCGQHIPAGQYTQHHHRRLVCPLCPRSNQWFLSNALSSHLVTQHQFNHCQLEYGVLVNNDISKDRGCVFRGRGEDIVFFIAGRTLYFLWLGSPAVSSASANIELMVALVTARTQQDSVSYTAPPLARRTDVVMLFSFRDVTIESAFKISVLIG